MNKKKRIRKRLVTLILVTIVTILTFVNIFISLKMFLYYDSQCFTTRDYDAYGHLRSFYLTAFLIFYATGVYLAFMLVKYKGKIYDKWFHSYRAYGVIDTNPDLEEGYVKLIFKRKGKYYLQDECFETNKIKRFVPFKEIDNIKKLSYFNKNGNNPIVGETSLVAYKYDADEIIVTTEKGVEEFLKEYYA